MIPASAYQHPAGIVPAGYVGAPIFPAGSGIPCGGDQGRRRSKASPVIPVLDRHRANDAVNLYRDYLADAPPRAAGVVQVVDEVVVSHAPKMRERTTACRKTKRPETFGLFQTGK